MEIPRINIPRSVIREIPPPVTHFTPPPVTTSLTPPVVNVPSPVIEYPTIDVPTREEFESQVSPPQQPPQPTPEPVRELPPPPPPPRTIDVPGVGDVPLPDPAPLVAAGATAVVTTVVVLASNIVLGHIKTLLDEPLKRLLDSNKKKVKLKQKKPVLHYVKQEEQVCVFEYSVKGTRLVTTIDKPEQYIRDQVEMSSVYEYDNKILINEDIKEMFTKEGAKRFKKHFTPAKDIVKKLSARLSI